MSAPKHREKNDRATLDVGKTLEVQEGKSAQTDAAQLNEPMMGAEASRQGFAPRHEPAYGEMRDALAERAGHDHSDHADDGHHIVPLGTYVAVFLALMVLLVITLLVYFFDPTPHLPPQFGWVGIVIAMTVATVKAVLVILFFMHVKYSTKLSWIFVATPFVFVFIMFLLTLSDYFTRGLLETAGK
jgi:cytochrome c oxidase subunit 4